MNAIKRMLYSLNRKLFQVSAFTLTEVMITIVIAGTIAAFGIPHYGKGIQKAGERDIIRQLSSVHAANAIYRANSTAKAYANFSGNITDINTNLSLNMMSNGATYAYTYNGPNSYTVLVTWGSIQIQLSEIFLDLDSASPDANPCCAAGVCLVAKDC